MRGLAQKHSDELVFPHSVDQFFEKNKQNQKSQIVKMEVCESVLELNRAH